MVDAFLGGIVALVVKGVNGLIAALGGLLSAAFGVLPNMPALPTPPDALVTAEGWVAWVFPVQTVVDVLVFTLSMFLVWQVVVIVLNWAKAKVG